MGEREDERDREQSEAEEEESEREEDGGSVVVFFPPCEGSVRVGTAAGSLCFSDGQRMGGRTKGGRKRGMNRQADRGIETDR